MHDLWQDRRQQALDYLLVCLYLTIKGDRPGARSWERWCATPPAQAAWEALGRQSEGNGRKNSSVLRLI